MRMWIIVGLLLATLSAIAFFYIKTTEAQKDKLRSTISQLEANNTLLKTTLVENEKQFKDLQTLYKQRDLEFEHAKSDFKLIMQQSSLLREKTENLIPKDVADFSELDKIINNNTKSITRCFELLTGAPLNDFEKNAKSAIEFNSNCPWFYSSGLRNQ